MTPKEREFWTRLHRRVSQLSPVIASEILRGFSRIRATLPERELSLIIARGDIETLITVVLSDRTLDAALSQVRQSIQNGIAANMKYLARDLPITYASRQRIGIGFDILNPRVIDAVRQLDTRVMQTLKGDVRETVRAFAENGLRDGVNPRVIAREIRQVVGLAPNQERAVANFRRLLETGDRKALSRLLRDKRFDRTLRKALGPNGTGLSVEQIDKMESAYRRRMIAFNAETNARTAALDSMKLAQHLNMEDAIEKGAIDPSRLMKKWVGVMDSRERPSHVAMEGETVPYNHTYSNGQMIPGDSEYNCRCISRYFQASKTH